MNLGDYLQIVRPAHLYHYTNISSLASILKNRTLKLNSLTKMDDLLEGVTRECKEAGNCVFVSSWTSDYEESIPLWKMYTENMRGVRIRLPINPFKLHDISNIDFNKRLTHPLKVSIHRPETFDICTPHQIKNILIPVIYEDEKADPIILAQKQGDGTVFYFNGLGRFKKRAWMFQNEWRYRVEITNMNPQVSDDPTTYKNFAPPFQEYFLDLDEEIIKDMEITLGPCVTNGDEIIVDDLKNKYNPEAVIRDSLLKDAIRG